MKITIVVINIKELCHIVGMRILIKVRGQANAPATANPLPSTTSHFCWHAGNMAATDYKNMLDLISSFEEGKIPPEDKELLKNDLRILSDDYFIRVVSTRCTFYDDNVLAREIPRLYQAIDKEDWETAEDALRKANMGIYPSRYTITGSRGPEHIQGRQLLSLREWRL